MKRHMPMKRHRIATSNDAIRPSALGTSERGPGRPAFAEGTARTGVFTIRLSDDERAAIEAAAERAGKPVTQWARETMIEAALRHAAER